LEDEWEVLSHSRYAHQNWPRRWVNDDEVTNCHRCKFRFSTFRRKHHCRLCKQIFCGDCSMQRRCIPKSAKWVKLNFRSPPVSTEPSSRTPITVAALSSNPSREMESSDKPERVCDDCGYQIDRQSEECRLWITFMFLDLKEIKNMMLVNKRYNLIAGSYYKTLTSILHNPVNKVLSSAERELLSHNSFYLVGHSKWAFHLYRIGLGHKTFSPQKITSCKNIGCPGGCHTSLTATDYVRIIYYLPLDPRETKHCCKQLAPLLEYEEAKSLIPMLVTKSQSESVRRLLLSISKSNDTLLHHTYWELLSTNNKEMVELFDKHFQKEAQSQALIKGIKETFLELSFLTFSSGNNYIKRMLDRNKLHLVIGNEIWIAQGINCTQIETRRSKSKPVILPFINDKGEVKRFLFKNYNLKKDFIISKVISLMIHFIKKELDLEFNFVTYNIFLLKNDCGLIEMIDDSMTIYEIRNKLEMSVLNYIFEYNKRESVETVRNRFMNSLAVYSVITYLLGIGDRHLDNIMVHKSGYLFHIDFEYILGDDPKMVSQTMRITSDMLETIGGKNSQNYPIFKAQCSSIFNCLRRHMDIFICMLTLLATNKLNESKIIEEVTKRFQPGDKYLSDETYVATLIDNSHDNFTSGIMDSIYRYTTFFRNMPFG